MILSRVRLQNVGAFEGENELLFETSKERPIVLIGGMNGAGKTTLFKAILIGLYGQGWEVPQSRQEYEDELRSLIYRAPNGNDERSAYIELEFRHTHLGTEAQYIVRREWASTGKSLSEEVQVHRDGEPLDDIDRDHWNQYIRELVPRGVSNLFFFDGEKVKDLASDDEAHVMALRESFDSLLGLDVVEQLRSDLSHVISTKRNDETGELTDEVQDVKTAMGQQREKIASLGEEKEQLKKLIAKRQKAAQKLDERLAQSGGLFYQKREDYKAKKVELESSIEAYEERLSELAQGSLPFVMGPKSVAGYLQQVADEQRAFEAQAAAGAAANIKKRLKIGLALRKELKQGLTDTSRDAVRTLVEDTFTPFLDPETAEMRHGYSKTEAESITGELQYRLPRITEEAQEIATELKKLRKNLNRVEGYLSKVPSHEDAQKELQAILQELGEVTKARAHFEAELAEKQHALEEANAELESLDDQLDRLTGKLGKASNYVESLQRAGRCRAALKKYRNRLRALRRETLQDNLRDCLQALTNKRGTYERIRLDENLRLHVTTRDGKELHFAELSAGERQVLATALLWALSKTSGRPLPFVIDTPLGRLDSKHRTQLVKRFYPQAAHQVIVLSTDTEIDTRYAKQLKSKVAKSYLLRYLPKQEKTVVKAGYFGGSK